MHLQPVKLWSLKAFLQFHFPENMNFIIHLKSYILKNILPGSSANFAHENVDFSANFESFLFRSKKKQFEDKKKVVWGFLLNSKVKNLAWQILLLLVYVKMIICTVYWV